MYAVDVLAFVRASLPAPPARILEVGAGDGALAADLREDRVDVGVFLMLSELAAR